MHVACDAIDAPVALVEHHYADENGVRTRMQILVFREGELAEPTLKLLRKYLSDS